ncbi:dUTP diphosphatase [Bacillus subtilis]|uniref:dUTP diphosphatase n=1 Tax=Bacillus subtilis TaxID=1423 RepID=UPI001ABECFFC|nr:dUTP diphosphatase [Bacillus subtilis]MBO3766149.1 dUTP diphosphatase [Bacillus subtilis]MEC0314967.1 dUTP diphosphatase [Bacillus subtilis]MEC0365170.1 dUTP diphosphatase [Bacillus subtilis]MEC0400310.1 dUTP diphosphatase [Bacillus subtilis]MEC0431394.1 dUTP diphosphatase [Bacillus subtilis]
MNLEKMFEMQKALDERIIKEKGLEGQDLLPNLILALQVELAECANEWRGFKHWSNDREPRICVIDKKGQTAKEYYKNPLLEEYVDCLHFILSIGNRLGWNDTDTIDDVVVQHLISEKGFDTAKTFSCLLSIAYGFHFSNVEKRTYISLFTTFFELGNKLGFKWEQIEAAYMEKNAVNHQRQQEGY